jgi:hypothetical protein
MSPTSLKVNPAGLASVAQAEDCPSRLEEITTLDPLRFTVIVALCAVVPELMLVPE